MAALGWPGMLLPGAGFDLVDAALLLEEMGRVLLPSPFLASAVIAAPLLLAVDEHARWLPALARGEAIATLALAEPGWQDEWGALTTALRPDGTLAGTKRFVPFAPDADLVLVVAEGPALGVVEGGVPGTRQPTLSGAPVYEVRLDGVRAVGVGASEAVARHLERARGRAAVATLAYLVGAAERALEMTVEHAKTRVQFGRPIGGFQAVAHRCADMRTDVDALRWLVYQAAWAMDDGRDWVLAVSAAKAYGNDALRRVFMHAHQVHGAIGFSTECDLQLFTRRAKAGELEWGGSALHRERVARAMGL
jgi:alkylation response protein AidB-like acyl-CoA dehydrogenase